MGKILRYFFFYLIQFSWGLIQNLLGLALLIKYRKCKKEWYHGALLVYHDQKWGGMSLGMFIFVKASAGENWLYEARIHEYGHTVQSLILGPLYLFVIGIPSFVWNRSVQGIIFGHVNEYYAFYPESWANSLGQLVTQQKMRLND